MTARVAADSRLYNPLTATVAVGAFACDKMFYVLRLFGYSKFMKFWVIICILAMAYAASAQAKQAAMPVYASNGTLIGLSNLIGLRECKSRNIDGKLRDLKVNGDTARFRLVKSHESSDVEVDLARLPPVDKAAALRDLIRKSHPLRVGGYQCESSDLIAAFSVDRIY